MSNLQTFLFTGRDREGFEFSEVYYAESLDQAKGIFFKNYHIDDEAATAVSIIHAPSESSVPGPANEEVVAHLGATYMTEAVTVPSVYVITKGPAKSTDPIIRQSFGGTVFVIEHDPDRYDKDIVFFPREWSNDPDLDDYDYDDEDTIEVRPAGAVLQWCQDTTSKSIGTTTWLSSSCILQMKHGFEQSGFNLDHLAPNISSTHSPAVSSNSNRSAND